MKNNKNKCPIYGFEDYDFFYIYENDLFSNSVFVSPGKYYYDKNIINVEILPVQVKEDFYKLSFEPNPVINHKELLSTASTVYVHPNCKLSRTLISEKYKKSLDTYSADVVVIPEPDISKVAVKYAAIFVDESSKTLVYAPYDSNYKEAVESIPLGTPLSQAARGYMHFRYGIAYDEKNILNAELIHYGKFLEIPKEENHLLDILTNRIPSSKLVYEQDMQDSLSSNNNQLTLDAAISIRDMINSSEDSTVAVGLKTLSVMDWMHYTNSVKYILRNCTSYWRYSRAISSKPVKYMLVTISGSVRKRWWPGCYYTGTIYKQDYELFKQLVMHDEHLSEEKAVSWLAINAGTFMKTHLGSSPEPIFKQ